MKPYIHLQENEVEGVADCGCVLNAEGNPKITFCPVHAAAPDLYSELKKLITAVEIVDGQEHADTDDIEYMLDCISSARAVIAKACKEGGGKC